MLARAATLRLLRRPFAFYYSQPLAVARLRLSTSSGGSNTPPLDNVKARAAESERRADPNAFKGMPGQSLGLPALVFLLGIVFAVNAWDDLTSKPEEATPETPEEHAARKLKMLPDEVDRVMADGRVLLRDGSIRKL